MSPYCCRAALAAQPGDATTVLSMFNYVASFVRFDLSFRAATS